MKKYFFLLLLGALLLQSCSSAPRFTSDNNGMKNSAGIRGKTEVKEEPRVTDEAGITPIKTVYGTASYYGEKYNGKQTTSGEIFHMNSLTAAHRDYPFGTIVKVTNLSNGKTVLVKINDRGPLVEGRIIDLSYGAAKLLGMLKSGTAEVRIDVLKWGEENK